MTSDACRLPLYLSLALVLTLAAPLSPAHAAPGNDDDALALQSGPEDKLATAGGLKLSLEGAVGRAEFRGQGSESLRRGSVDLYYASRLSDQWRFTVSDRMDALHPKDGEATVNSLRELYVGWQNDAASWIVEAGRINLRQGPALGYNPTDFFRDNALRVSTTVNPLLVREYRLGSFMLRAQKLWSEGSLSLSLSPKLENTASADGWNADLGATNARNRALVSLSTQWSQSTSTQLHLYEEQGGQPVLGAGVSSLLGSATVAFAEWTWSREPTLSDRARGSASRTAGQRLATGLTYTTASKLALTAEYEYNGFALTAGDRDALAARQPFLLGAYLFEAARRQDLAARSALMLYAKQTDVFTRNLDLTALLRANTNDHSTLAWLELRYHWSQFDLSLQALQYRGRDLTEYGASPYRRTVQALVTWYF